MFQNFLQNVSSLNRICVKWSRLIAYLDGHKGNKPTTFNRNAQNMSTMFKNFRTTLNDVWDMLRLVLSHCRIESVAFWSLVVP